MGNKIFKWVCPRCGKEIRSIYETQFNYNKKLHEGSHQKEVEKCVMRKRKSIKS